MAGSREKWYKRVILISVVIHYYFNYILLVLQAGSVFSCKQTSIEKETDMGNRRLEKCAGKAATAFLSASMFVTLLPNVLGNGTVLAYESKDQDNTFLGVSGISNPEAPKDNRGWTGNYVYFGMYDSVPIKFRVLQKDSQVYSSRKSLFLDSDLPLFDMKFDDDDASKSWKESDVRKYLNDEFLYYAFTDTDINAILKSSGNGKVSYGQGSFHKYMYGSPVSVDDKLFLLDAGELTNTAYGYSSDDGWDYEELSDLDSPYGCASHKVTTRLKYYSSGEAYWMRSSSRMFSQNAGYVHKSGVLATCNAGSNYNGVAPALNIDQSYIIFSSRTGEIADDFKLTLLDNKLNIALQNGLACDTDGAGNVTVPFAISGSHSSDVNRVSVLILDKEYTAGNTNGAKILYYDSIAEEFAKKDTGSFKFPSSLDPEKWGKDYHVYILAEMACAEYLTDYASRPVEISSPFKPVHRNEWVEADGIWHYYDGDGNMVKGGWYEIKKVWYYFNADGDMMTDWQQIGGSWYYLGSDGAMRTGWKQIGGKWYYFKSNGVMVTGWQQIGGKWYYFNTSGVMQNGWQQISGKWYFFDGNGIMQTGWYASGSSWYYLGTDGVMVTGWKEIGGSWYYFNSKGIMQKNWQQISGKWYYFNDSGAMQTGLTKIGGTTYYFKADGTMATGWVEISGSWYYFESSGAMHTGWLESGGKTYYFKADGKMVTGWIEIDGVWHRFNDKGEKY